MTVSHGSLLKSYLKLPDRLEGAIAGLDEAQLDLTLGTGWSIREYVHHTVEGEQMWQIFLRAILGMNGIEIPIQWYFALTQDDWAKRWVSSKRAIGPTLSLFRGSTASLVEMLRNVPPEAWKHYGCVSWPDDDKETRLTVRDIVLMHIGHMNHHTADIQAIRAVHKV
jgi:uncharacterized damage-inducible protein DinB